MERMGSLSEEGGAYTYSGTPILVHRSASVRFDQTQPPVQHKPTKSSKSSRRLVTFATEGSKSRERRKTVSICPEDLRTDLPQSSMERRSTQRSSYHRATRQGALRQVNSPPPAMSQSYHPGLESDSHIRRRSTQPDQWLYGQPHPHQHHMHRYYRAESAEEAAVGHPPPHAHHLLHPHASSSDPRRAALGKKAGSSSGSESGGGSPVSSGQLSESASDQGYRSQESPPGSHSGRSAWATTQRKPSARRSSRQGSLKGILRSSKSEANLKKQSSAPMSSGDLSSEEVYQIRLMFSGKGTEVRVSQCLANLYFSSKRPDGRVSWAEADRELKATGVPVLVCDEGSTRARSYRRLHIILAERGTGFLLWKDTIDSLSKYTEVGKSFHTLFLSTNHQRAAGLSFDSPYAAMKFHQEVAEATSDPSNVALSQENLSSRRHSSHGLMRKSASKPDSLHKNQERVRKSEISQPCGFAHITSLKPNDLEEELRPKRAQSCIALPSPLRASASQLKARNYE